MFDPRGSGYIDKFSFDELDPEMDVDELIYFLDLNGDKRINYTEWTRAITPKNTRYKPINGKRSKLTPDELEVREHNWKSELKNLLQVYSKAEKFNFDLRQTCQINADRIFDAIDYKLNGHITIQTMSKYLKEECGYCLHEDEQKLLLARYDKAKDFRISRDEFHA